MKSLICTDESVRGILAGRKTMTRRVTAWANSITVPSVPRMRWAELGLDRAVVDSGPSPAGNSGPYLKAPWLTEGIWVRIYPRLQPGDLFYVKEVWTQCDDMLGDGTVYYRADQEGVPGPWKSPLSLPGKWARIICRCTDTRAERLQEISVADCDAEGLFNASGLHLSHCDYQLYSPDATCQCGSNSEQEEFAIRWDAINGKKPGRSWKDDPWVWVYTFKVEEVRT